MRKVFTLAIMAALSMATFAQRPYGDVSPESNPYLQSRSTLNAGRVEFKAQPAGVSLSRSKAAMADEAITEQPDGELMLMRREGTDWLPVYGSPAPADYTEKGTYVVKGTDGNYYFKNFVTNMCNGGQWVKGTVSDGVVTVDCGQICTQLWYDNGSTNELYTYYLFGLKGQEATGTDWYGEEYTYTEYVYDETVESIQFKIEDDGSLSPLNPDVLFGGLEYEDEELTWPGYGDQNCSFHPFSEVPQKEPEGLEYKDYIFVNKPYMKDYAYAIVQAAIANDKLYLKGFNSTVRLPEGYVVVADISGDKATISGDQFLGVENTYSTLLYVKVSDPEVQTDEWGWSTIYDYESESPLVLNYDAAANRFDAVDPEDGLLFNAGKTELLVHDHFYAPIFYEFNEVSVEPAAPVWTYYMPYSVFDWGAWGYASFNLYTTDVDGNYILPEKLFFSLYFDDQPLVFSEETYIGWGDEPTTEIGYNFSNNDIIGGGGMYHTVYFYESDFTDIGVQTIYRGGGDVKRSPVVYYVDPTTSVKKATTAQVVSTVYTDVSGRQRSGLVKGLNIVTVKYADGSQKSKKLFVK